MSPHACLVPCAGRLEPCACPRLEAGARSVGGWTRRPTEKERLMKTPQQLPLRRQATAIAAIGAALAAEDG